LNGKFRGNGVSFVIGFGVDNGMIKPAPFFKTRLSKQQFRQRENALLKALKNTLLSLNMDRESLIRHQESQMKRLLVYANESIPFYRKLYQKAQFEPDHFQSLDDLHKIPMVTKSMLRQADISDLQPPQTVTAQFLTTSGSTGEPVGLYKSDDAMWMFMAAAYTRYHQWCGDRPIRNVLYILDDKPGNIDYTLGDLLRTMAMEDRFVSSFATIQTMWDAVDRFHPHYISTYPSVIRNLSLFVLENRWTCPWVTLLNLTSEMLDTHTRHLIRQGFPNARIIETYTSTEAGFMGYQCGDRGGFHLSEDMGIYELHPVENDPGLRQLIVTDLVNFATPLIRYSGLGDIVTPVDTPCQCGSNHIRIDCLQGRIVDSVELPDGSRVTPYVLTNIVSDTPGILKYQIIQNEPDAFLIKIVMDRDTMGDGIDTNDCEQLENRIQQAFRDALKCKINCHIQPVDDIQPEPGHHKVPLVVSGIQNA
jgi:phenylacetate-coenzyme A ligase PaaK-like adenylate-forming protein